MVSCNSLNPGIELQHGKYKILSVLGQGGFGITYEAEQILLHRKVAIKEFFMKDCCERDMETSHVSVGTGTQRELVSKFRSKFIREAQMIAEMDHPYIVRVLDVFEENGTAYYVMDNLPGGSLSSIVKESGPLDEAVAEKYIRQVADALEYIHSRNTVHLDVKPSNILLNTKSQAVLIDFGISKHYDDAGEQTSSTPVGISKGFAPLEQGRDGDVSQFKPSTDIYALGATLYFLVTGVVPPEATIVNEEGLERPTNLSNRLWRVIEKAMQPKRKDRPQSIEDFLRLFSEDLQTEETEIRVVSIATESEKAHQEAERKAQEAKLQRLAEEVARQEADLRAQEAEKRRIAEEKARLEAERIAEEAERQRIAEEKARREAERVAQEAEKRRIAEEKARQEEKRRIAEEKERQEAERRAQEKARQEAEKQRLAEEKARREEERRAQEAERQRIAKEKALREAEQREQEKARIAVERKQKMEKRRQANDARRAELVRIIKNILASKTTKSISVFVVILIICAAILFLLIRTSGGTSNMQGSRLDRLLQAADTVVFINGKPYPMVFVSGGTFEMGESDSKHRVTLDGYYIGTIEVTQSIWNSVVSNNPSHTIGDELPVDYLSYNHCIEFITRINNSFGHNFSLPTEAQWEYAAIGGEESKGHVYSGSDDINTVAWNLNNSNKKIHPVAYLLPNELGIYDMTGNVREWCSDYYADYPLKAETNPKGPKKGDYVCLRGGDISSSAVKSQVTRRSWGRKNSREFTGFRLVLNPSSSVAAKMNESTVKEIGSVRFASTPSGAVIWIDGKNTQKTTPVIINGITVGKHSVYLSLDGYETYECMITVTSKKRGVLDKVLEKQSNSTPQNQSLTSSDGVTKSNPSSQNVSEGNFKTNNTTYQEVLEEEVEEEAIPFQLTEQKPSFNGGDANEFSKWVNSRLVYPEVAKEYGLQGRITLQFTVEADGSVTNVRVLQGAYSPNERFDKIINECKKLHKKDESVKVPTIEELRDASRTLEKEAVRVVSSSPKWIPGKQRDRAVKVTYTFPVIFQLR